MNKICTAICGLMLTMAMATGVKAEADGPDYYRVTGVASDDVLNIRAKPTASSAKVGAIPHNGDGVRNRGCEGGLSYEEWANASDAERKAAERRRWCRISFQGVDGWVAGRFLAEGSAPQQAAASPSFDCAKASSSAEEEICNNPQLARMDRELARLYGLAKNGPNMTSARAPDLKATQRGWIKGRNDCWKASIGLAPCVTDNYAMRIHEIRTEYYDSRQDDAAGISAGPFPYACEGVGAVVSLVSIATEPAVLSLRWRDKWITPVAVRSASGARYEARTPDGPYEFWSKGDEATLTRPDGSVLSCKLDDMG